MVSNTSTFKKGREQDAGFIRQIMYIRQGIDAGSKLDNAAELQ